MKRVTDLLHLFVGIALLVMAAYFIRGFVNGGKSVVQRESAVEENAPGSAKPVSASDDPLLSAANLQTYGVLSQQGKTPRGDGAVSATGNGNASQYDHLNAADTNTPNHFLHRRLTVKTTEIFEFEVPPRAIHPELRGTFRPVARHNAGGGPFVEVLLLNDREFAHFVDKRPVAPTFSEGPASHGDIRWELNIPHGTQQKYYLVFRNSSETTGPAIVDANFTASFE